jgi:gas vesicle protein
MRAILALLTGLGAGAAVMYLFDPKDGNRRRAMIRDQATKINRQAHEAIEGHTKDISNRAKGMVHQLKSSMKPSESSSTEAGWSNGPAL